MATAPIWRLTADSRRVSNLSANTIRSTRFAWGWMLFALVESFGVWLFAVAALFTGMPLWLAALGALGGTASARLAMSNPATSRILLVRMGTSTARWMCYAWLTLYAVYLGILIVVGSGPWISAAGSTIVDLIGSVLDAV